MYYIYVYIAHTLVKRKEDSKDVYLVYATRKHSFMKTCCCTYIALRCISKCMTRNSSNLEQQPQYYMVAKLG